MQHTFKSERGGSTENDTGVYLASFGAAQTVTGSKHILYTPEVDILIDCGLFQGIKSLRIKNWETPGFEIERIGALCLTHAHLDHCGYIPRLVGAGYRGKIYMTAPTRELTELILRDSAKIQEEDAWKANRYGYSKHHPAKPLYTLNDVERCLHQFVTIEPGVEINITKQLIMKYMLSGHIPGACSIEFTLSDKKVLFSGDIGRMHSGFLDAPQHGAPADVIIMESTYGDRLHGAQAAESELEDAINSTLEIGGNVMIPCFAVGRAQEIIRMLYLLKQAGKIPQSLPVYLDSPMAAAASEILLRYPQWSTLSENECRMMMKGLIINEKHENTIGIIKNKKSKIIIAGSGMLSGGRILEYLKHYAGDKRNCLILSGFQAEGTRGRALLEKTHEIRIDGQYFPVRARTVSLNSLSAHADQHELIEWLKSSSKKETQVFLVHGEPGAQESLRVKIRVMLGFEARISREGEKMKLFDTPGARPENKNKLFK
jgi:metallo-beta-lactamase family protein